MIAISNDLVELRVDPAQGQIVLTHRAAGTRWRLDPGTLLADGSGRDRIAFGANRAPGAGNAVDGSAPAAALLHVERVQALGDRALVMRLRGPAGELALQWELRHGGCDVIALAGESTVTSAVLPGALRPEGVDAPAVALPKNQGIWHRGTGEPFCFHMAREGHTGWSMPFVGVVGPRDALVHIIDDEHDARIWFEKREDGRIGVTSVQDPARGRLRYDRRVRLRFVEPQLTAICGAYRQHIRASGHLVTWEEKIAARPNLERLFGALMCFIGYCQDEQIDYAAGFRELKRMGFDRAFVYPLSMGNLATDFLMGGRPPIDIRRHLGLLEELGYLAASWMWVEDVPEDPENVMLRPDGQPHFGWQIEDRKWMRSCPVRQVMLANRIQDERMRGHTAQHFDVTASRTALDCFHPDHPLDRRDDAVWRRKVLETAAARGCAVSSEGFWGYATPSYDIGSVKIAVPVHADWYTVPMTSLVYHDACMHDWWEIDNYNNPHHRTQGGRDRAYFPMGGGFAALQAAQDALMGAPPNVMPFGAQYAFVGGRGPRTELYRYSLDMPEVIEALRLALPVARLHRRIGRLACVRHETLAEDGSVQATTFADGTRVVANYADEPRDAAGIGMVEARSWKAVQGGPETEGLRTGD